MSDTNVKPNYWICFVAVYCDQRDDNKGCKLGCLIFAEPKCSKYGNSKPKTTF
jgi:hypothetical protein